MKTWFPSLYDVKFMMQARDNSLGGGLSDLADQLQGAPARSLSLSPSASHDPSSVVRIGPQHQAGSDSLLTALTFFELMRKYLPDLLEDPGNEICGRIYGLNYPESDHDNNIKRKDI